MKRILVTDDNDDNLYLARFLLEKSGYEVIEARNGIECLELAVQEKPDLIIVDIQLPDIDGLEVTRRIRASEAVGDIPIIAFTSYAIPGDERKALAAGCNGYITKPMNVSTFISEIEECLQTPKIS
jgi:two-component system cell cycle response regulator DivK